MKLTGSSKNRRKIQRPGRFALCVVAAVVSFLGGVRDSQAAEVENEKPSRASGFEPSQDYPFGRPNPLAPPQLAQFEFMIGSNDCIEQRLNNATQQWIESERIWDAHYTMNGYAIMDVGVSGNSSNSNLRIFDPATDQWHVHFFSMPVYGNGIWSGGLQGDIMVLKQPQRAPGTELDGFSRLTFYNLSDSGFDWVGEWVSEDGTVVFPFWRISCDKNTRSQSEGI